MTTASHRVHPDLHDLDRFFVAKIAEHGATPMGVDWKSPAAQQIRFTQLLRVLDHHDPASEASIIDYGCGYGAFAQRLAEGARRFTYTGYDMCEPMIEAALSHVTDPRCRFVLRDSDLRQADFTVACGLFSLKLAADEDRWRDHVESTVGRLAALSRKGFAFNLLTRYADPRFMRPDLFYGDPGEYLDLCLRHYSHNVALLHDYGQFEFTLIVRLGAEPKPPAPPRPR